MPTGEEPPPDYSTISGSGSPQSFTIPLSEAQANAVRDEINRISRSGLEYSFPRNVCSTVANQIMRAAGLGENLYLSPTRDAAFLGDAANTLALNPNARITSKGGLPIPDGLRGLQQDYAYVGGGYDTPSERIQRVPVGSADQDSDDIRILARRRVGQSQSPALGAAAPSSFEDRFGSWPARPSISDVLDSRSAAPTGDDRNASATGIPFFDEYVRYLNQINGR